MDIVHSIRTNKVPQPALPTTSTYCGDATSASFTFMPATCVHSAQGLKQNAG